MEEEGSGLRQLSLAHTRTLKMTDDVLCIRISPNGKQSETQQSLGVCFFSRRVRLQDSLVLGQPTAFRKFKLRQQILHWLCSLLASFE